MNSAEIAIIYMSEKAFEIKNKAEISDKVIRDNFNNQDIKVFRTPETLTNFLGEQNLSEYALLLMTSGNYDGVNWSEFLNKIK